MKYEVSSKHFIPGSKTLKNKLGISDPKKLNDAELDLAFFRSKDIPEGGFSSRHLQEIHKHLFQDIYEWAGEYRDVPLSKGENRFAQPQFIDQELKKISQKANPEKLKHLQKKGFVSELTDIIDNLNAVHPFLEGNGRTIRAYSKQLCKASGYNLDVSSLKGNPWNEASKFAVMGDNLLLKAILSKNVSKEPIL